MDIPGDLAKAVYFLAAASERKRSGTLLPSRGGSGIRLKAEQEVEIKKDAEKDGGKLAKL